ncbi:MAG: hypothetical protein KAJ19_24135 [Gammaproteobacteria bacterium]|nr:hypothetical protein [Gammaproteobacteria bacterium]
MSLFTVEPLDESSGSVSFSESITLFADRDLGDGAKIDMKVSFTPNLFDDIEIPVVIEWVAWNKFLWRKRHNDKKSRTRLYENWISYRTS